MLWSRLERRRILVDPRVADALRDVPASPFVARPLAAAGPVDAPLPASVDGLVLPSPRFLATWLQMLELGRGTSFLLLGSSGGWVEALLARLVEPATLVVWEEDATVAEATRASLAAQGFADRVRFVRSVSEETFERVAATDAIQRLAPPAQAAIADGGFAVFRRHHEAFGFVKVVRSDGEFLEMAVTDLLGPTRPLLGGAPAVPHVDLGRELFLERIMENVWRGRPEGVHDEQFRAVVDSTFARGDEVAPMGDEERERYEAAKRLFHLAYIHQGTDDLEVAAELYRASLAVRRTAEAHTFLGWVYSFVDRHEDAIEECEKAIAVDPTLGNPYNDIGAYLVELDRLEESIPWFEKAKRAPRYCCYQYPHANLGRVYMLLGMPGHARRELEEALRIHPGYEFARDLLRRLQREGGPA